MRRSSISPWSSRPWYWRKDKASPHRRVLDSGLCAGRARNSANQESRAHTEVFDSPKSQVRSGIGPPFRSLGTAQSRAAASRLGRSPRVTFPDLVRPGRLGGFAHRSGHRPRRRMGNWCLPDTCRRPRDCRPRCRSQARALRILVRLIMTRHLAQTAHQGEALVGIFLGRGVNIQLKPVLWLLGNEFLHMGVKVERIIAEQIR